MFLTGRTLKGTLYGGWKPKSDLPSLVDMYTEKVIRIDEYITHNLQFEEINKAFSPHERGQVFALCHPHAKLILSQTDEQHVCQTIRRSIPLWMWKAPPTALRVASHPPSTLEKGTAIQHSSSQLQPRAAPVIPARPQKNRSCCCKCICWTMTLIVLLLIIIGPAIGVLYLVFKPKLPNYSIDSLRISDLWLNFDMTLYAKFDVKITANNPNKKIGIHHEKGEG
ncbi:NDR1/HIN1-like protein 6 [Ziziphus jujuba]|uniref:NDR1/HIN1-like protein 6 n=1 Tax=Ziziphus jujuba TaxID=326968 RepID=A0ABM4A1R3_ZIZJJ|nr:NDR1/HIN1-like protein 6 [Ziziphus jujuba]XP_060670669.1 NDR1/HIN1-like protein 6 [Ziziphus jujuba]